VTAREPGCLLLPFRERQVSPLLPTTELPLRGVVNARGTAAAPQRTLSQGSAWNCRHRLRGAVGGPHYPRTLRGHKVSVGAVLPLPSPPAPLLAVFARISTPRARTLSVLCRRNWAAAPGSRNKPSDQTPSRGTHRMASGSMIGGPSSASFRPHIHRSRGVASCNKRRPRVEP